MSTSLGKEKSQGGNVKKISKLQSEKKGGLEEKETKHLI